ncbi:DUF1403 family protein [Mesorhizobium sp. AR07]|uniref:DUF1403 family protein n=1 Tax=Mesorhizobium sp. AR07 TaxID=2865838 RepID=UPI0039B6F56A
MILRPKPLSRHAVQPLGAAPIAPMAPVPSWLRRAVETAPTVAPKGLEDVALAAGAAIGALDPVVRRDEKWAGAWRQRLALAAAATTARQAGRTEDEAALRDSLLLTRPGDDCGPAGLLLLAWRRLAARPAVDLLTAKNLAAVLEEFGFFARDSAAVGDLADELRQLGASAGTVGTLRVPSRPPSVTDSGASPGRGLPMLCSRKNWDGVCGAAARHRTGMGRERCSPGAAIDRGCSDGGRDKT